MLQMTTLELTDSFSSSSGEPGSSRRRKVRKKFKNLLRRLDHLASSDAEPNFEAVAPDAGSPASNGSGDLDAVPMPEGMTDDLGEGFTGEHGEEGPSEDGVGEEASRDAFEEIDFGREFQDYLDPGYKTQEIEYKEDAPTFEQFLTRPPSLADHLEWQLHMSQIDPKVCEAAVAVIGNLNADGRLNATTEEIAKLGQWSEEIVEQARQVLLRLDPVGCGARDVKECLLVQLEVRGEQERLAAKLITDHFAELQQHKLPNLSKQIGIDVEVLLAELQFIRTLDPYPGRRYRPKNPFRSVPEIHRKLDETDDICDSLC